MLKKNLLQKITLLQQRQDEACRRHHRALHRPRQHPVPLRLLQRFSQQRPAGGVGGAAQEGPYRNPGGDYGGTANNFF